MTVRVLVVDDSAFFRKRLTDVFNADSHIEVVGTASNGAKAIEEAQRLNPDVITMDIEMPVMDGITAVRHIMDNNPTPVLMCSSLTTQGAKATFDALDAGAVDFFTKDTNNSGAKGRENYNRQLCARVRIIGAQGLLKKDLKKARAVQPSAKTAPNKVASQPASPPQKRVRAAEKRRLNSYEMLLIGTSTGGPVALREVLTKLPSNFPLPIVLIQHMPASFTEAFAKRLDEQCQISIKLAVNDEFMKPGVAYMAPGGQQLDIERQRQGLTTKVYDGAAGEIYQPSVDVTFKSVAKISRDSVLAIVLTGMGRDGCIGAKLLQQGGSSIWAQDEESCVVYGMPMAVVEAGIVEQILPLDKIGDQLVQAM